MKHLDLDYGKSYIVVTDLEDGKYNISDERWTYFGQNDGTLVKLVMHDPNLNFIDDYVNPHLSYQLFDPENLFTN